MAKKKAAKKAAKKPVKKAVKAAKRPVQKAKAVPKKAAAAAPAIVAATDAQPEMVDVSEQVKKDALEMPPPPAETKAADPTPATTASSGPVEKHEEFTQALTQEPPKKGFWSRLFGK